MADAAVLSAVIARHVTRATVWLAAPLIGLVASPVRLVTSDVPELDRVPTSAVSLDIARPPVDDSFFSTAFTSPVQLHSNATTFSRACGVRTRGTVDVYGADHVPNIRQTRITFLATGNAGPLMFRGKGL